MTDREMKLAKQAAAKLLRDQAPGLSESDRDLLRKYPKHTLEQAREIEAAARQSWDGYTSGFDKIVAQERGNIPLGGDHT
jgi:hypothetical protein